MAKKFQLKLEEEKCMLRAVSISSDLRRWNRSKEKQIFTKSLHRNAKTSKPLLIFSGSLESGDILMKTKVSQSFAKEIKI